MSKNTGTAVVKADADAAGQPLDMLAMGKVIVNDLGRAEVGIFCMLRAGVGLLVFKELSGHGEWEQRLLELGGGKSPRTLQMYMQTARRMCEQRGVTPQQAWAEAVKIDASQAGSLMLEAPPPPAQIADGRPPKKGKGGKAPPPPPAGSAFKQMLLDFIEQRKNRRAENAEPPKPLTKKEKVEAAVEEGNRVANLVADWAGDATWALMPDEELESVWAGIRSAAEKLRGEMLRRKAGAKK
jgi:hypothetical protein